MLQATAQAKGIGLEAGVDTRIPFLYADPNRVLQVLSNLVENAIKFTPNDGSVMVKACLTENDPDFVHVSVTDTGRGISPEAKALIFERLYQDPNSIDDSRKGLGLGLYISRELVRLHGGQIWVESQLSHGSTFVFTLPLFSLAKFLAPIITSQGRLRQALSLISVELSPRVTPFAGNWQDIRQHCLQMLELAFSATRTRSCPP
jgi:signal transduction histidine kinase